MKLYKFLVLALVAGSLFSCVQNDDQSYPDPNKPVVTSDASNVTIVEGESYTFTLNLSRAIADPTDIKITQTGGTSDASDYTFSVSALDEFEIGPAGYQATIPATQTSYEVTITAEVDIDADSGESATFSITQGQNGVATVSGGQIDFTVSFTNTESDNFYALLEWDGEYTDDAGEDYDFCDFDLDILIEGANGANYDGATGACPEEVLSLAGDLPDGDYTVTIDYYASGDGIPTEDFSSIPARLTLAKPGVFVVNIDLAGLFTDFTAGSSEGNGEATIPVANVNIDGTTYTVTDYESGAVLGQGKIGL